MRAEEETTISQEAWRVVRDRANLISAKMRAYRLSNSGTIVEKAIGDTRAGRRRSQIDALMVDSNLKLRELQSKRAIKS